MKKPSIIVNRADHARLTQMANGLIVRNPELADELLEELERARVGPAQAVPPDSVQIGSTVEYRLDDGRRQKITLVYPADADSSAGRVSVLTPVGVAVLGLSTGQKIDWSHNGRSHGLTIESVTQPVAEAVH